MTLSEIGVDILLTSEPVSLSHAHFVNFKTILIENGEENLGQRDSFNLSFLILKLIFSSPIGKKSC